jgi:hypothetical protein
VELAYDSDFNGLPLAVAATVTTASSEGGLWRRLLAPVTAPDGHGFQRTWLLMANNTELDHQYSTQKQDKITSHAPNLLYNSPSSTCTWKSI